MNKFSYVKADAAEQIVAAAQQSGSRILAGGTDLIPLMKDEIMAPSLVIDITGWRGAAGISSVDGGLRIGALTSLNAIAASSDVRLRYPALAEACSLAATEQLRNMGTIGGNLLQQTRCWYYRGQFNCWLKGGEVCYAREGENENHSIFANRPDESPCVSAHPSDPAAALIALDARVMLRTPEGEREVPLEQLYALPTESRRSFVTLPEGALITEVLLPSAEDGKSTYVKAMARASWAFALAGIALSVRLEGGQVAAARIAMSGVAPIPMRARQAEEQMKGTRLAEIDVSRLGDALVSEANPLSQNGYKVHLLRGLLAEALDRVAAP